MREREPRSANTHWVAAVLPRLRTTFTELRWQHGYSIFTTAESYPIWIRIKKRRRRYSNADAMVAKMAWRGIYWVLDARHLAGYRVYLEAQSWQAGKHNMNHIARIDVSLLLLGHP